MVDTGRRRAARYPYPVRRRASRSARAGAGVVRSGQPQNQHRLVVLDEGFGTLDAETLDTALDALDSLNASGKTIGVISHVEAMKERIPVQMCEKGQWARRQPAGGALQAGMIRRARTEV